MTPKPVICVSFSPSLVFSRGGTPGLCQARFPLAEVESWTSVCGALSSHDSRRPRPWCRPRHSIPDPIAYCLALALFVPVFRLCTRSPIVFQIWVRCLFAHAPTDSRVSKSWMRITNRCLLNLGLWAGLMLRAVCVYVQLARCTRRRQNKYRYQPARINPRAAIHKPVCIH